MSKPQHKLFELMKSFDDVGESCDLFELAYR
jgi:hypothetical protein